MPKYEFYTDEEVKQITLNILQGKEYPKINYSNCENIEEQEGKFAELIKIVRNAESIEGKLINSVRGEVMNEVLKDKAQYLESQIKNLVKAKKNEIIKSLS